MAGRRPATLRRWGKKETSMEEPGCGHSSRRLVGMILAKRRSCIHSLPLRLSRASAMSAGVAARALLRRRYLCMQALLHIEPRPRELGGVITPPERWRPRTRAFAALTD